MALIQTIVIALLTLGILVAFHEFGHFWVARRCGVKVLRFSIGFGRAIWQTTDRYGTEYTIAAIPLGGYVKMLDEREGDVAPSERGSAFNSQSVWKRIAIVSAGPLANFLFAILVFWGLFLRGESGLVPVIEAVEPNTPAYFAGLESGQEIVSVDGRETPTVNALNFGLLERLGDTGEVEIAARYPGSDVIYSSSAPINRWLAGVENPDPLSGLGITLEMPVILAVVDEVTPEGPAERAGFLPGDEIVAADDETISDWGDWVDYVRSRPGSRVVATVVRDGMRLPIEVVPERRSLEGGDIGSVGMSVQVPAFPEDRVRTFERGPIEALVAAVNRTLDLTLFTFESMIKMLKGLISPDNLSGPITIAQIAASSAESGLLSWFSFLALLSVSLGALNLLPIPVLDGGHLLFYGIEAISGRAVPERIQAYGYQLGFALVLSLMAFALYNDVARL